MGLNKISSLMPSKKILILIAIGFVILGLWRFIRVINAPNLLVNTEFEGLADWQIVNQNGAQAVSKLSDNGSNRGVLELNIADSAEVSWVGVGQRVFVVPGRRYGVWIDYQLAAGDQSLSNIVLRVSQFDQAGQLITTEEISLPGPPVAGPTNKAKEQSWSAFTHKFITNEETAVVEIGVGLFGHKAATVEIDDIIFKNYPTWFDAVRQDPIIPVVVLLLVGGIGYSLYRIVALLFVKAAHSITAHRRVIALAAVNILLFFVFAELVALGIHFVRGGKLFYADKPTYELIVAEGEEQELTPKRMHPYFGYVDRPGWPRNEDTLWQDVGVTLGTTNNHGFGSDYDYPFVKSNEKQFIIGIFGGSVAEQFAVLGKERLIESLQKDNFFAAKEIIVLNFAKGGYKQPQQLLVLAYFLSIGQTFDMVINIDGFNEVVFAHRNYQRDIDISMPHINILDGLITLSDQTTLTPEKIESLARINRYKTSLNKLAETINNNRLASLDFILEQYYALVFNNYQKELIRFEALASNPSQTSLLFVKPDERMLEDAVLFEYIADNWADSSVMMSRILKGSNVAYFHFLQPNQYYSNRVFSHEEAERAFEGEHPYYSTLVGLGYPVLIEKFDVLEENNVDFYNGIPIFDGEPERVYRDNCCHYNQLGNQVLAEFIAASILGSEDFKGNVALSDRSD